MVATVEPFAGDRLLVGSVKLAHDVSSRRSEMGSGNRLVPLVVSRT